jgi:acyl dehydratase
MKLKLGDKAIATRKFTYLDVFAFAQISGDFNPIHLDAGFAKQTMFKKPIVHGFLYASMISNIIANDLPGPGSIYLKQVLNFKKPVFYDDVLTATVVIEEIKFEKSIYTLQTTILNSLEDVILKGQAVIKLII